MYEFIESSVFAKYVHDYLTEEEYAGLQWYLSSHPDAGDVIPASGGCRKLRWGAYDKGKRGGVRVIYYGVTEQGHIWLLAIYAKSRQANLPANVVRLLKEQVVKP
jgi:mRNA-degrading endonuclease RelE of RelBE toxin-antitoxin system